MKILPYNHLVTNMWEPKPYISHGCKIMDSRSQNSSHEKISYYFYSTLKTLTLAKSPKF
jgi:hypothetical protein